MCIRDRYLCFCLLFCPDRDYFGWTKKRYPEMEVPNERPFMCLSFAGRRGGIPCLPESLRNWAASALCAGEPTRGTKGEDRNSFVSIHRNKFAVQKQRLSDGDVYKRQELFAFAELLSENNPEEKTSSLLNIIGEQSKENLLQPLPHTRKRKEKPCDDFRIKPLPLF